MKYDTARKSKTPYQQYLEWLRSTGQRECDFRFSEWKEMRAMEAQMNYGKGGAL